MKNSKKKTNPKLDKILKSKKIAIILSIVVFTPFLVFGGILLRDSLLTGKPVEGQRFTDELEHKITKDHLKEIEEALNEEMILNKELHLQSATLRVYITVSKELSKDVMKEVADRAYATVDGILPIDTYFKNTEDNKQYDLEINVINDVEDFDAPEFVYLQIMKTGSMEDKSTVFLTDAKDADWKEKVLETHNALEKQREEDKANEEGDSGGE